MTNRRFKRTAPLMLLIAVMIAMPAAAKNNLIFEILDPRGDDHGDGNLVYPLRTDFTRGDLDVLSFRARRVAGATQFEAVFANPIRRAGREAVDDLGTQLESVARHGFYTFNLDVYIDQDREPESGAVATMPGRKAEVSDAWDRAIILTPRPHEARGSLERLMVKSITQEMRRSGDADSFSPADLKATVPEDIDKRVFFPTRVRVRGNKVTFLVPDSFLDGPARSDWSYTVAVSGSNLLQSLDLVASVGLTDSTRDSLMILPVSPGTWAERFGGGREGQELQPPLIDILVPEGISQERVLSDYDSRVGRAARLPGVVPAETGVRVGDLAPPATTPETF